ncbi:MAG: CDP-alcohol phosphatidyltransferase family protein [Brachybacterium sp.]|nr:CDP-alcohol phosphatidyltransferase family protein [Brachybacterium sp.]
MTRGRGAPSDWATIPNAVTVLRLLLLVPVCVLLVRGPDTVSVVLLLVWAATDWIDGALARVLNQRSRFGEVLDPIADRIGLVGIVLSLALADLLPWAALVILALADIAVLLYAGRTGLAGQMHVSRLGKARTGILMGGVFLLAAVAAWVPSLLLGAQLVVWLGVALHAVASIGYLVTARQVRRRRGNDAARNGDAPEDRAPAWRR